MIDSEIMQNWSLLILQDIHTIAFKISIHRRMPTKDPFAPFPEGNGDGVSIQRHLGSREEDSFD